MWNDSIQNRVINNDSKAEHLGGGVVVFRNAIDLDWKNLIKISSDLIDLEWSEMYKDALDPETGEPVYINKSGYFFSKERINAMPKRAASVHYYDDEEVNSIFNSIESIKDYYLLKYFELFPLAYKCVWWKVKGHILKYEKNVYLGSHSDISADYIYGVHEPSNQLALRNVVTSLVYFNSSVEEKNYVDGVNFVDGNHYFNYLNIEYQPNQGDIIMFPANYMAAHEVRPVKCGSRFTYLGWYSQGTPNDKVSEYVADPNLNPEIAAKATNVYMPTLNADLKSYLTKMGYDESSEQIRVTKTNY
jgi:hypothetical protein